MHISALSNKFVKDPRDVVRVGQTVKVRVQDVDIERKRIALTMRLDDAEAGTSAGRHAPSKEGKRKGRSGGQGGDKPAARGQGRRQKPDVDPAASAMAAAFARLKR